MSFDGDRDGDPVYRSYDADSWEARCEEEKKRQRERDDAKAIAMLFVLMVSVIGFLMVSAASGVI